MGHPTSSSTPRRDDRFFTEYSQDQRSRFERDRDRVLYTSAFHRLGGITQVASADEGHVFHNRLTHTLEVAQVARRVAEKLVREDRQKPNASTQVDADVVETCALIHDLGHPPFGHIAEVELDRLITEQNLDGRNPDGFEGNAQSFRIVTKLARRTPEYAGLNLTRATLNGTLKYPWLRWRSRNRKALTTRQKKHNKKWSAYDSEKEHFEWARESMPKGSEEQALEAQIMDWADDVTYAVHDTGDFYRCGLIPLDRLRTKEGGERGKFYERVFSDRDWIKQQPFTKRQLTEAFDNLMRLFILNGPYVGTIEDRALVRRFTAGRINECIRETQLSSDRKRLIIPEQKRQEIWMLKQLTWQYVIHRASLATKQEGQRRILRELFTTYHQAALKVDDLDLFPPAYVALLKKAKTNRERTRLVCDMIAGMTEDQAINTHRKLTGINLGSVLDPMNR